MADKIKKIKLGNEEPKEVYDVEAAHSINGYTNAQVEAQNITFANVPISEAEIEAELAKVTASSTN
jgi:hypothetical protein